MSRRISYLLCIALLALVALAGCIPARLPSAPPTAVLRVTPPPAQSAPAVDTSRAGTGVPAASPEPPATSVPPVLRQQQALSVTLDYAAHQVEVSQVLTYPNTTGAALGEIVLQVDADALLKLEGLALDGVAQDPQREGPRWRLLLARPLAPGALARIETRYTLALPAIPPGAADSAGGLGWTARQTNLAGWYPVVPPYRAGEWLLHRPFGAGENGVLEAADYRVDLRVRAGTAVTVAASAAPGPNHGSGGPWYFAAQGLRSFAISAGDQYVLREARAGATLLRAYLFPEDVAAGEAALQAAAEAVQIYGAAYGAYPYAQLALVEGDFGDGLECAGLFFVGRSYFRGYDGTPRNWLTIISVHEASHQWWYGLIGDDQALEPWLDEAFATYSEVVYYRAAHPELEDWWWNFRVRGYAPSGPVNSSIYDLPAFRPYVNAVYLRGALFLDDLHKTLGDDAFFTVLRRYVARYQGRIVTGEDFWSTLEVTPDIQRLRAEYFK